MPGEFEKNTHPRLLYVIQGNPHFALEDDGVPAVLVLSFRSIEGIGVGFYIDHRRLC